MYVSHTSLMVGDDSRPNVRTGMVSTAARVARVGAVGVAWAFTGLFCFVVPVKPADARSGGQGWLHLQLH
jgi:hypothetical protein